MKKLPLALCVLCAAPLLASGCRQEAPQSPSSALPAIPSTPRIVNGAGHGIETSSSGFTTVFEPVGLAVSGDGRWLSCRQQRSESEPSTLVLFDARTGAQVDAKPLGKDVDGELYWSGPGRLIASAASAQVWKVSAQGKLSPVATFGHPKYLRPAPEFGSPEPWKQKPSYLVQHTILSAAHQLGARVVKRTEYQGDGRESQYIEVFSPKASQSIRSIKPPGYKPVDTATLAFAPAGEPRLLVGEAGAAFEMKLSSWEPRSGKKLWQQSVRGLNPQPAFSPDGTAIVVTQVTGSHGRDMFPLHETVVLDARTGKKTRSLPTQHTVYAASLAGEVLATYGTQSRPEKKQFWTSIQLTNWKSGRKILHCWMPASTSSARMIAASPSAVFGNGDGLRMWKISDLKSGKGTFKTLQDAHSEPGPDDE